MDINRIKAKLEEWTIMVKTKVQQWTAKMKAARADRRKKQMGNPRTGTAKKWNNFIIVRKKLVSVGKIVIALLLCVIIALLLIRVVNRLKSPSISLNSIETKTSFTVEEIKKILEFNTVSYYEEQLLEKEKTGPNGWKTYTLIVIVKGAVHAGFDLSYMKDGDITEDQDGTLHITLPKVKLNDPIINPNDIDIVVGGEDKVFGENVFTDADMNELIEKAKCKLKDDAKEDNILGKAEEQGKKEVECFFRALGYDKVIVTIKN